MRFNFPILLWTETKNVQNAPHVGVPAPLEGIPTTRRASDYYMCLLDYHKLLKSAVTDHPQKDTFQNSSKVSVDPMRVLDSLMPSTTIEHLNRLSPLFSLSPVDITTIQMCLHTTDIYSPMFASLDLIRNTPPPPRVKIEIQEHHRLVISQDL